MFKSRLLLLYYFRKLLGGEKMKKIGAILFIAYSLLVVIQAIVIMQIHIRVKKPMHKFL